jgi:serine/threonine protein kinase
MSLSPGKTLDQYEILSALGEGGMGAVYRARDTKLNRDVAIKFLLPSVATILISPAKPSHTRVLRGMVRTSISFTAPPAGTSGW